jgi:hypothetical protein
MFEIGDLVCLKEPKKRKKTIRSKLFGVETSEQIGIGIITEKLEQLLILPDIMMEGYFEEMSIHDLASQAYTRKTPVQTAIVRVLWIKIDKNRWEYEEDLDIYKAP